MSKLIDLTGLSEFLKKCKEIFAKKEDVPQKYQPIIIVRDLVDMIDEYGVTEISEERFALINSAMGVRTLNENFLPTAWDASTYDLTGDSLGIFFSHFLENDNNIPNGSIWNVFGICEKNGSGEWDRDEGYQVAALIHGDDGKYYFIFREA